MTTDEKIPALQWLQNNKNSSAFASNRFGTTQNAIKFIKSLMKAGASVQVSGIYDEPNRIKEEGGAYADILFVQTDFSNRDKVLKIIKKAKPDEVDEEVDNYWRLWWD